MNFDAIKSAAKGYEADMTRFLRDLIALPSESCEEEGVIRRIAAEMEKVGFDKVEIDGEGNVLGWMGHGEKIIAYDAHIDTVGIGNRENWKFDPYEGYETDAEIGGRGGSDQEGGIVSSVYGAKIMKLKEMMDSGSVTDPYIGYVGAYPYAEVVSGYTAFFLGIRSIVPTAHMDVTYTNSWFDITAEGEAANSLISRGCVIIGQHADSTGAPSAVQAAHVPGRHRGPDRCVLL